MRKVLTNALYLTLPKFLTVGLNLILTPLFIHSLGLEAFGTWSVFQSLMFYLLLLDFGVGGALVKFIAEAHTQQAYSRVSALFSTVFYFYLALSGAVFLLALFLREPFCTLLRIPEPNTSAVHTLYLTTFIAFAFYALTIAIISVFEGAQAFELSVGILSLGLFLSNAFAAILLLLGFGLDALAWGHLVAMVIMCGSGAMVLRWYFPHVTLSFFNKALLRELFQCGVRLHLYTASLWLITRLEVPLVSSLLGTSAAGTFRVAMQLSTLARELPTLGLPALFSAAVSLHTAGDTTGFNRLTDDATKYLAFATLSFSGFLFFNIEHILRFWLNAPDISHPARIAQWLLIGFTLNAIASVPMLMLRARSDLQIETRLNLATMILHLLCNLTLLYVIGESAMGLATLLVVSLLSLLMMQQCYTALQASFRAMLLRTLLPMTIWTALWAAMAHFVVETLLTLEHFALPLRTRELVFLMLSGLLFAVGQVLLGLRLKLIDTSALFRAVQK
ncbi:MAG: oligosaccharide flippase family protein [Chloroherpetonaceae bacterium]|nr:oligosaccharide flippase family protein [Chloroherpetonaceae bacterium]MCS7210855.1 oligosaccharide flippase family protein [Chloroherpetonaceae bacterium]MDW8018458.1 oligosaccharide flippase family protein [Chloroherpetonaceae bacterium]MDW8466407.1 oligosaccharide flippase family protein [Chloroherpetonaceae bacterium]